MTISNRKACRQKYRRCQGRQHIQTLLGARCGSEHKPEKSNFGKRTDADIAESAKNVLGWTSSLPADAVKVLVEGG